MEITNEIQKQIIKYQGRIAILNQLLNEKLSSNSSLEDISNELLKEIQKKGDRQRLYKGNIYIKIGDETYGSPYIDQYVEDEGQKLHCIVCLIELLNILNKLEENNNQL